MKKACAEMIISKKKHQKALKTISRIFFFTNAIKYSKLGKEKNNWERHFRISELRLKDENNLLPSYYLYSKSTPITQLIIESLSIRLETLLHRMIQIFTAN